MNGLDNLAQMLSDKMDQTRLEVAKNLGNYSKEDREKIDEIMKNSQEAVNRIIKVTNEAAKSQTK